MARKQTTKNKTKQIFIGVFIDPEMASQLCILAESEDRKRAQMHRILLKEALEHRAHRSHPGEPASSK